MSDAYTKSSNANEQRGPKKDIPKEQALDAPKKLERKTHETFEGMLNDINSHCSRYVVRIKSTMKRSTLIIKRIMAQVYVNTCHLEIASKLNSIVDETRLLL